MCAAEICLFLPNRNNHLTSHNHFGVLIKNSTHAACWDLLVAPGCNSQYEREEEDGACDGPDDDVCAVDT